MCCLDVVCTLCYLLLSVIRPGMTQVIMQEPIIFKISLKV